MGSRSPAALRATSSHDPNAPFCHHPSSNINQHEVGPLQTVAPGPTEAVVLIGGTAFANGRFGVNDVAAAQLRSRYGKLSQALMELRVTGRTNVGANSFHPAPGVYDAVKSFG